VGGRPQTISFNEAQRASVGSTEASSCEQIPPAHELDRRNQERVVRGRFVNENGDPVARAIGEPASVQRGQSGHLGALDRLRIDVLAVTDDAGEFRLGVLAEGDGLSTGQSTVPGT
jgi:hypothetical protein